MRSCLWSWMLVVCLCGLPVLCHAQEVADSLTDDAHGAFYEEGLASYYSARLHGRKLASGEKYDKDALFCAHKELPFGTRVRVVNKKNGKEVIVKVKDRGPFGKGRVIDLSHKAAHKIGMLRDGVVMCELWVLP